MYYQVLYLSIEVAQYITCAEYIIEDKASVFRRLIYIMFQLYASIIVVNTCALRTSHRKTLFYVLLIWNVYLLTISCILGHCLHCCRLV